MLNFIMYLLEFFLESVQDDGGGGLVGNCALKLLTPFDEFGRQHSAADINSAISIGDSTFGVRKVFFVARVPLDVAHSLEVANIQGVLDQRAFNYEITLD